MILAGCAKKTELYGNPLSGSDATAVSSILAAPAEHDGKTVKLAGKITSECMTGCWFDMEDETGTIYDDIKPSGLAIPQRVGSKVVVEGTVKVEDGRPTVVGKALEIK